MHIFTGYMKGRTNLGTKQITIIGGLHLFIVKNLAFNRLRAKVGKYEAYKVNDSNLMITTPLGTHIHFKSADKPDNLFGEDVYSIVFDEAPRAKVDAFYALRSTITATKGVMKMIGNFGGVSNWVHQLKEKANKDPEYAYFNNHGLGCSRCGNITTVKK